MKKIFLAIILFMPSVLAGAVETLPTSGYNEGTFIYNKLDHTLYISTKTITATGDWKSVW